MGEGTIEVYSWRRLGIGPKRYEWRLKSQNGQIVATSGSQGYNREDEALAIAQSVVGGRYAGAAVVQQG